jgi:hypothetical protein
MNENNIENIKSFWFHISNDYRSGRSIYTYTKPPKYENENIEIEDNEYEYDTPEEDNEYDTPEEASEIKFNLPKKGKRIFIVIDFPEYKPIWYKDIYDDENTELLYLKIFSQIHDFLPFIVTGQNCAYKEEGYYPDVPIDIKNLPNIIDKKLIKRISECEDEYYFIFIVDSDGDEIRTDLLNPI